MKCFRFSQRESKEDSSKRRKSTWWPSFSGSFGQDSRKSGSEIRSNPPSDMSAASPSLLPAVCLQPNNLRIFSLSELKAATRNFNVGNFLGEGGFGCVYKGWLRKNNSEEDVTVEVAVKLLNARGHQGHKEWLSEVKCLGLANHPNLVKLVGYCVEDDDRGLQMLLVYEFMPNRSLEAHLFGKGLPVLHWQSRLEIALGAAQGLAYLHEELEFQIIYRDFKTSNILLDKDFKPKLSDFGLARQGPDAGASHVTTASNRLPSSSVVTWGVCFKEVVNLERQEFEQFLIAVESSIGQICLPGASHFGVNTSKLVGVAVSVPYFGAQHVVGTMGYAAPEYVQTGQLTSKSDVWSFGVVLLELLTGRKAVNLNLPKNEQWLLDWVKPHLTDSRKIQKILDPRLSGNYSLQAAQKVASLASHCLLKTAKSRPKMSDVVDKLKLVVGMPDCQLQAESSETLETEVAVSKDGTLNPKQRYLMFKEELKLKMREDGHLDWRKRSKSTLVKTW